MNNTSRLVLISVLVFIVGASVLACRPNSLSRTTSDQFGQPQAPNIAPPAPATSTPQIPTSTPVDDVAVVPNFSPPLDRLDQRAVIKPFGIKISPADSPVQPERFSGYHSAVDYEILPGEADTAVAVRAVCTGVLQLKRSVSGYGGVVVQQCLLDNQAVTVVYGHVALSSIDAAVADTIMAGTQLGILGTGYSAQTDGERKHLHLGVHRGGAIDLRGYVSSVGQLNDWIDFQKLLAAQ